MRITVPLILSLALTVLLPLSAGAADKLEFTIALDGDGNRVVDTDTQLSLDFRQYIQYEATIEEFTQSSASSSAIWLRKYESGKPDQWTRLASGLQLGHNPPAWSAPKNAGLYDVFYDHLSMEPRDYTLWYNFRPASNGGCGEILVGEPPEDAPRRLPAGKELDAKAKGLKVGPTLKPELTDYKKVKLELSPDTVDFGTVPPDGVSEWRDLVLPASGPFSRFNLKTISVDDDTFEVDAPQGRQLLGTLLTPNQSSFTFQVRRDGSGADEGSTVAGPVTVTAADSHLLTYTATADLECTIE